MNTRKRDICNVDVHRASYVKHLRSKKHLEKEKQNELIILEWLFKEPIEYNIEKIYNTKTLKQVGRDKVKIDDKELNKELAKKMLNPYYLTDRNLKVGIKINLESHHINHAISKLTVSPNLPESGIEVRYIKKITKKLSITYARLINQYKFKYQTLFQARFDKQDEHIQVLDELITTLNINHNFAEKDIKKFDIISSLEPQIQQKEMKVSGWRFDKINSMVI